MSFNEYDDSGADDLLLESMLVDDDCDDVDVVISDDSESFDFVECASAGLKPSQYGIDCESDSVAFDDSADSVSGCYSSDSNNFGDSDLFGEPVGESRDNSGDSYSDSYSDSSGGLFDGFGLESEDSATHDRYSYNRCKNDTRNGSCSLDIGKHDDSGDFFASTQKEASDADMESVSKSALSSLRRGSSSGVVIGGCSDLFCSYFMNYCRDSSIHSGSGSAFGGLNNVGVSAFKRLRDKFICIDFADDNSDEFAGQIGLSGCDGFFDEGDEPTPFVDSLMLAVSRRGCVIVLHNMESFLCNKNAEECIKRAIDECVENGNKIVMMFKKKFNTKDIKLPDLLSRIGDFYKLAL